jgi:CDP-glycerol glycerophosphotransferase (TagB/SpsB family)
MFLQHGTFYTEIEKSIAWLFQQYDKINVASRKEAQFIAQILPKSFLQRRDPFLIGGLPRWDRLVDAKDISLEKKYTLFMPTWRDYIDSQSVLESSMYYRKIKEFCSSEYVEYLRA